MTAFFGVWLAAKSFARRGGSDPQQPAAGISMLFRGAHLEHASNAARFILARQSGDSDWSDLYSSFSQRFPTLPRTPDWVSLEPLIVPAQSPKDTAVIKIEHIQDCTHVHLIDQDGINLNEYHRLKSMEIEHDILCTAASTAPCPTWMTDENDVMTWHNNAYAMLYQNVLGCAPETHDRLFQSSTHKNEDETRKRASLQPKSGEDTIWMDVRSKKVDAGRMHFATDIDAVIRAEIAQRNFVQTLAKTFAQLSIGLAIFDRNSQLALFNPALIDLTDLPVEFLSARPELSSFFDRLRDARVMPEPKNYTSWRQEIADVISAATNGRYEETWTLESGQTFRVTGRPHPDGAIAFLIEDISAEILVTRNFRAELELSQSLMDTFDDALVVFSSAGLLQFCNASYRDMWKLDPDNSFAQISIIDSLQEWQKQCLPHPAWGDIRDFVMNFEERTHWEAQIVRKDHSLLRCHIDPIASGATLIRFEAMNRVQSKSDTHKNLST